MKIEHVFSYNDYTEEQKVKLAEAEFYDYALVWWNKNQRKMMREEGREIDTWTEMRRDMRNRYVPTSYNITMQQKLQRLSQGSLTMEEYYKEREMTLMRANIEKEIEDTMAHFLSGLNIGIRDVELQEYVELDDLLHKAVRVEQQLEGKIAARRNSSNNFNQNWTNRSKKERGNSSSPHEKSTVSSVETKHNSAISSNTGTRNIKCFRCLGRGHITSDCPTKRTMIMKADGEITNEYEINEEEVEEELEEAAM